MGIFNPATTYNMRSSVDLLAVRESQARMYVFTGLRIVDASSFRFLPSIEIPTSNCLRVFFFLPMI